MDYIYINDKKLEFQTVTYISPYGNDLLADGSINRPYKSMKLAVDNTLDGNCIYFLPGIHKFNSNDRLLESQFPCYLRNLFFCSNIFNTKIIMDCNETNSYEGRYYYFSNNLGTITNLNITFNSSNSYSQYSNALFVWSRGDICNNIITLNTKGHPSCWYDNSNYKTIIQNNVIIMNSFANPYSGNPIFLNNITNFNTGVSGNDVVTDNSLINNTTKYLNYKEPFGIFYGKYKVIPNFYLLKYNDLLYNIDCSRYDNSLSKFINIPINDLLKNLYIENNIGNINSLFKEITVMDKTFVPIEKFDNFKIMKYSVL